jgi:hypothetical protein
MYVFIAKGNTDPYLLVCLLVVMQSCIFFCESHILNNQPMSVLVRQVLVVWDVTAVGGMRIIFTDFYEVLSEVACCVMQLTQLSLKHLM